MLSCVIYTCVLYTWKLIEEYILNAITTTCSQKERQLVWGDRVLINLIVLIILQFIRASAHLYTLNLHRLYINYISTSSLHLNVQYSKVSSVLVRRRVNPVIVVG